MIEDFQIKGLNKLVNSGVFREIYPMVDRIDIMYEDEGASGFGQDLDRLFIDIHLNDDSINELNMYDMGFDPYYLVDYHLKKYLPYFNIEKIIPEFIVWGPKGDVVYSYDR
jgi:hypothetical protein